MRDIDAEFRSEHRRLEAAYRALEDACGPDADLFSRRWRAQAQGWRFDRLNELIREHNTWYPVEASLPMSPRTCDYVPVNGSSYRRIELGADWVLEHFPPAPQWGVARPPVPARAPREPQ